MNRVTVLDNIPFKMDMAAFFEQIHVEQNSRRADRICKIVEVAMPYVRPIALYKRSEIEIIDDSVFLIDGRPFKSYTIRELLLKKSVVYPNIVTCGRDIESYSLSQDKMLEQYITMELCNYACSYGRDAMLADMQARWQCGETFDLFPGEGDWEMLQGIQIYKIFEKETSRLKLSISKTGTPRPSRTAFGLVVSKDNG